MLKLKVNTALSASVAVLIILCLFPRCQNKGAGGAKEGGRSGGRGNEMGKGGPLPVRTEKATFALASRSMSVTAPLEGRTQAEVYAKVSGRLSYIGPKEGEQVKIGTLLFRVDRNDPGESFLNVPVVSPISGWVGRWMVTNIGTQVGASAPVLTVVDDEYLRTTVYLSTTEWLLMNGPASVTVTVGDETKKAKIVSVARAADSVSGRGSALVEVENRDHKWRAGMIARVQIDLEPKQRMLVSSAALNITDQGTYIFTVAENKAQKKPVSFTLVNSDTVEILTGLDDGTDVVVAGGNYLTDKATVQVVETAPEKTNQ